MQDLPWPKKNQESRCPKSASPDIAKLTQLVFDMKAEMGSMCKAMIRSGISFDKSPNEQKPRERTVSGKQKAKFAGTAKKKNRNDKIAQLL